MVSSSDKSISVLSNFEDLAIELLKVDSVNRAVQLINFGFQLYDLVGHL